MTELDWTADPIVEAEIKEQNAALIRQMVAVGIIICGYADFGWNCVIDHRHGKQLGGTAHFCF